MDDVKSERYFDARPNARRSVRIAAAATAALIVFAARLITGVRAFRSGAAPAPGPTVYFANHTSHGDFVLLWASLPPALRRDTRPVAAADYWRGSAFRRFIGADVFRALLISRDSRDGKGSADPVAQMAAALHRGESLILFPEGTRNTGDDELLPLKSGLYHLATACPGVRLVPVWIRNLKRVLPKGTLVPLPLACSVHFGLPVALHTDETKAVFMQRARAALLGSNPSPATHAGTDTALE